MESHESDSVAPPPEIEDLLLRPLVGVLGTARADGWVQCNPMWFAYSSGEMRMSHTTSRTKLQNLRSHPLASFCVVDPDNTYRYAEVRMTFLAADPDKDAAFHLALRRRYGMRDPEVKDAAKRVILRFSIDRIGGRHMEDRTG